MGEATSNDERVARQKSRAVVDEAGVDDRRASRPVNEYARPSHKVCLSVDVPLQREQSLDGDRLPPPAPHESHDPLVERWAIRIALQGQEVWSSSNREVVIRQAVAVQSDAAA